MKHLFLEGKGRRWCLVIGLNGAVGVDEHASGAEAAVDAAHGHEEAEAEEVAVVAVADAVVEPGAVMIHLQHTAVTDAAVMRPRWFGNNALFADGHRRCVTFHLWGVARGGGGGLIIVEDDHHQVPVAKAEVPRGPGGGVGADDRGQHKGVDDDQDGAGQNDNQTHKNHTKPAGQVVHQPVHWLEEGVYDHIRVGGLAEAERAEQQPAVEPQLPQPLGGLTTSLFHARPQPS